MMRKLAGLMLLCAAAFAAVVLAPKLKPKPVSAKPAAPPAETAPAPKAGEILMLSPSVRDGARLYAGWPMILDLAVWRQSPDDAARASKPITVKAKSGTWADALVITAESSSGAPDKWPLHAQKVENALLTVGGQEMAAASWWLSPEETRAIAEGNYRISAAFDPKRLADDPPPVASDNYYLAVAKEPTRLDKDLQEEKDLSFASYHILKDDSAAAQALVAKVLAANPESIGGHRLNGRLLFLSGKSGEALTAYSEALDIYYAKYPDACPPWPLLAEKKAVLGKMEFKTAPAGKTGSQ